MCVTLSGLAATTAAVTIAISRRGNANRQVTT
jgi:hypothetical protein